MSVETGPTTPLEKVLPSYQRMATNEAEECAAAVRVLRRRLDGLEKMLLGHEDHPPSDVFSRIDADAARVSRSVERLLALYELARRSHLVTPREFALLTSAGAEVPLRVGTKQMGL